MKSTLFAALNFKTEYFLCDSLQSKTRPLIIIIIIIIKNNNNNKHDNVYGAVIMAEPLREFTRFI